MLLYRVFPFLPGAVAGQPGSAEYLHPRQGRARWDNPGHYLCWYLANDATGAVGEVFAQIETWNDAMFEFPLIAGSRRALGIYSLPDDTPLLDLDDANALVERALRPTQVVSPNRSLTQGIASGIFEETRHNGTKRWEGLSWWSFQRSSWPVHCVWGSTPACQSVEDLGVTHPAVQDAAQTLNKPIR